MNQIIALSSAAESTRCSQSVIDRASIVGAAAADWTGEVPLFGHERQTACRSFNDHHYHFVTVWDLRDHHGETAHTTCFAFGMELATVG